MASCRQKICLSAQHRAQKTATALTLDGRHYIEATRVIASKPAVLTDIREEKITARQKATVSGVLISAHPLRVTVASRRSRAADWLILRRFARLASRACAAFNYKRRGFKPIKCEMASARLGGEKSGSAAAANETNGHGFSGFGQRYRA